ncbi:hypothetical protein [Vibrio europaeus]|uniref:hypothetical protein n=1 Tax=Vibrio europaeus TaxID=300876 RepID=UPI00233EF3B3|nr:hypothetical protein [Vibrio europaeus]MDC5753541.1 hypothetical protein [Vibrio europaeus]MDC5816546.1 hypothetical protein [Vibrio europaeus]
MEPKLTPEREKLSHFIDARLSKGESMNSIVDEVRKMAVDKMLIRTRGNITAAAKTLCLSRGTTSKINKG